MNLAYFVLYSSLVNVSLTALLLWVFDARVAREERNAR